MRNSNVWITQYALSKGIEEYRGITIDEDGDKEIKVVQR